MKLFAAAWLGIVCFALSFPAGSAEPRILWEWNTENSSIPAGAELIRQPGEKPFLRVRGPEAPAFPIDGALLKGKMVTVEGRTIVPSTNIGRTGATAPGPPFRAKRAAGSGTRVRGGSPLMREISSSCSLMRTR